jgi:hypothetical protein
VVEYDVEKEGERRVISDSTEFSVCKVTVKELVK